MNRRAWRDWCRLSVSGEERIDSARRRRLHVTLDDVGDAVADDVVVDEVGLVVLDVAIVVVADVRAA